MSLPSLKILQLSLTAVKTQAGVVCQPHGVLPGPAPRNSRTVHAGPSCSAPAGAVTGPRMLRGPSCAGACALMLGSARAGFLDCSLSSCHLGLSQNVTSSGGGVSLRSARPWALPRTHVQVSTCGRFSVS